MSDFIDTTNDLQLPISISTEQYLTMHHQSNWLSALIHERNK